MSDLIYSYPDEVARKWKAERDLAMGVLKKVHRKHNQGCDDIGWSELSDIVHNALCELMGDKEYCKWLETHQKEQGE